MPISYRRFASRHPTTRKPRVPGPPAQVPSASQARLEDGLSPDTCDSPRYNSVGSSFKTAPAVLNANCQLLIAILLVLACLTAQFRCRGRLARSIVAIDAVHLFEIGTP